MRKGKVHTQAQRVTTKQINAGVNEEEIHREKGRQGTRSGKHKLRKVDCSAALLPTRKRRASLGSSRRAPRTAAANAAETNGSSSSNKKDNVAAEIVGRHPMSRLRQ